MAHYIAVKIKAPSDPNGNPRRGWLVYERPDANHTTGPCVAFVEEGYAGNRALDAAGVPRQFTDVICELSVPYREWQAAVRDERERVTEDGDIRTRLTAA